MKHKHFRYGLIGAGAWGRKIILAFNHFSQEHIVLTAVASCNPETKRRVPPSCQVFQNVKDFFDSGVFDAVFIASSPETHAPLAVEALERNIPVLIEKPFTLSFEEALRVKTLAEEKNVPVMIDHIYLFHSAFKKMKGLCVEMGAIHSIESTSGNWGPFRSYSALWDYGPHDLAMCLDILGEEPVACYLDRQEIEGMFEIHLDFSNNVFAKIKTGNTMKGKKRKFVIFFKKNQALIFDDCSEKKLFRSQTKWDSNLQKFEILGDTLQAVEVSATSSPLENVLLHFSTIVEKKLDFTKWLQQSLLTIEILEKLAKM